MQFFELIDGLCEAIDARHSGCEIEVSDEGIRVIRTFSYPSARDLLITDVLRAVASPDWRRALADAQSAQETRVKAYEEKRRLELEETRRALRLRGTMMQKPSLG